MQGEAVNVIEALTDLWPYIAGAVSVVTSVIASGHVILYKRDVRAVILWVGLIWFAPVLGALLYVIFGVNRIKRRAKVLRGDISQHPAPLSRPLRSASVSAHFPDRAYFDDLDRLVARMVHKPLTAGNHVVPLINGDIAFPEMIGAIDGARRSVSLSTYIFDRDEAGSMFLDCLRRAVRRGVEVRVLIDDMGSRYSWPPMDRRLRRAGIRTARFLPTLVPWRIPFMNLRNHRKILVIDGETGFTGGMNIRLGHILGSSPRHPVKDLHFRLEGPVVAHLQEVFVQDWVFTTGEVLEGDMWFPELEERGAFLARGIPDGPDEDFEKLLWAIEGSLACARSSVQVVTPYFLPDPSLVRALNLAAMRGVEVDVILPVVNNIPPVKWAATTLFPQLLESGCRIWLVPPPFDHSKIMIVDGVWVMFGSGNWDSRSLRLNFEFNVECYSKELAAELLRYNASRIGSARQVSVEEVEGRRFPVKLRDGIARLLTPYL